MRLSIEATSNLKIGTTLWLWQPDTSRCLVTSPLAGHGVLVLPTFSSGHCSKLLCLKDPGLNVDVFVTFDVMTFYQAGFAFCLFYKHRSSFSRHPKEISLLRGYRKRAAARRVITKPLAAFCCLGRS